ncbi:MAG: molybdopterin-binding protein [Proteobacteria bacterium]|nr:molybdopterin-binding protein [Pseudomonadota bacterium]
MKTVPVEDAVGMVLCHDITQITPGDFKGRAFKKGHIIQQEDIPKLLDLGKRQIFVWELSEGFIHENDAAMRMATAAAGPGISLSEPKEGKVSLSAQAAGLLKINVAALNAINEVDQAMFATLHSNQKVTEGKTVAGTRIIPLVIEEAKISRIEGICQENYPVIEVKPFKPCIAGIVTTGSEVFYRRIEDKFGPVLFSKFSAFSCSVLKQIFVPDSVDMISESILTLLEQGAELIAVTGGMSVDPDDVTPAGIRAAGGRIVTYGAPTLPGAMFLLAYIGTVPVIGLPGCVMYHKTTIFDLMLPRILAGEVLTRQDIISLGHGGLCANCQECRYPDCGFGKGI